MYTYTCISQIYICSYEYICIYRVSLLRRGSDHGRGSSAPDEGRDGPEGASSSLGFPKHMNSQSDREEEGVTQVCICVCFGFYGHG